MVPRAVAWVVAGERRRGRVVRDSSGRMGRFSVSWRWSLRPGRRDRERAVLVARVWVAKCESSRSAGHTAGLHRTSKERYRLSFFDEVDEPPRTEPRTEPRATPRTTSRAGPRRRRTSGRGGGRPPNDQQAIQVRRVIAIVAIIVVIVLIAIGIHSCQVSSTNSALQDYANSVSSLNRQSAANGKALFTTLAQAAGSPSATTVQN